MNKYIKGSPQPIIDWLYKKGYTYAIDTSDFRKDEYSVVIYNTEENFIYKVNCKENLLPYYLNKFVIEFATEVLIKRSFQKQMQKEQIDFRKLYNNDVQIVTEYSDKELHQWSKSIHVEIHDGCSYR